jgi:hypothetical protein
MRHEKPPAEIRDGRPSLDGGYFGVERNVAARRRGLNSARILAEKLFKVAGNGNGHLRRAKVGRLTRVSEGLVSTLNGRPVFSDAVSRVADSLLGIRLRDRRPYPVSVEKVRAAAEQAHQELRRTGRRTARAGR